MPTARKRTRAEAFIMDASEDPTATSVRTKNTINGDADGPESPSPDGDADSVDEEQRERAQEVWNTFKEEYYETVEQFPLSLQRSFELMKELEAQVQTYNSELLSSLQFYIRLRKLSAPPQPSPNKTEEAPVDVNRVTQANGTDNSSSDEPKPEDKDGHIGPHDDTVHSGDEPRLEDGPQPEPVNGDIVARPPSPPAPSPLPGAVAAPTAGLAPPPHAIPPHLRADAFAFSSAFSRPGTPGALSIPEERRLPPRSTQELLTHIAWLADESAHVAAEKTNLAEAAINSTNRHIRLLEQAIKEQETAVVVGLRPGTHPTTIHLPEVVGPSVRRANGSSGAGARANDALAPAIAAAEQQAGRAGGVSLKITLPPAVQREEDVYCVCRQPHFGDMIGCDDTDCPYEWFHYECIGITEAPKTKTWYCPFCIERRMAAGNASTKKKGPKRR